MQFNHYGAILQDRFCFLSYHKNIYFTFKEEDSVKNKFFTRQIYAYAQIRRIWQEWRGNIKC